MKISAVDLFCGAGGLSYGLEQAGIPVTTGVDIDPDSKYPYEANADGKFLKADLAKTARRNPEQISSLFARDADVRVLAGCAPCQPFSPLNHGGASHEHEKWGLLNAFGTFVETIKPDIVVMENVFEVRNHRVYEDFVKKLEKLDYWTNDDGENPNVYCPEYDIPQKRKRWVLVASRDGPIELVDPVHTDVQDYPTVKDKIDHLDAIEAGEVHPDDPLHQSRTLSETNLERVRLSEPGDTWEAWIDKGREDLILDCHRKDSGSTYKSPYGRMVPDEPSPTITTQFYNYGSGRFGHYDTSQNRAISLREGAMLQSFPEDYQFFESEEDIQVTKAGRMIGNAVPPKLAKCVGKSILHHVEMTDRQMTVADF